MSQFEEKTKQQQELLQQGAFRTIESQIIEKRTQWFREKFPQGYDGEASPRAAFELLFFEKMKLSPEDLPVLSESDEKIVWSSNNPCPTLEACRELKLDTRPVCRSINEKATQAFVSLVDPQLRFHRSYEEIRPHSHHCKEWIVRVDFVEMMGLAIEEARLSRSEGNKGYGAVVVLGDRILSRAHDTAITENDPSLHAEVNAIRQAVHTLGDSNLCGAVLFSSCEPCPMCASLAVWANVTTIVFGASIETTARLGKSRINIPVEKIVQHSPVYVEVIGDVLGDECLSLYQ